MINEHYVISFLVAHAYILSISNYATVCACNNNCLSSNICVGNLLDSNLIFFNN
jgi:hypothetical protein